jgi:hypothetical protein
MKMAATMMPAAEMVTTAAVMTAAPAATVTTSMTAAVATSVTAAMATTAASRDCEVRHAQRRCEDNGGNSQRDL